MKLSLKNIELQYQGYRNTSLLWKDHSVFGMEQLQLQQQRTSNFNRNIPDNLLLGKRVERFVIEELRQNSNIEIVLENVQVQDGKITIGEIDCILKQDDIPIHVEIIYKFYLYDLAVGSTEIEHWIGPNRNDTLLKKLTKLKDKQLPLIQNEHAITVLNRYNLLAEDLLQRVFFKAQLFTPYKVAIDLKLLNQDCLKGFYIHVSEIQQFSDCTFYIPRKIDWLLEAQTDVDWMIYNKFQERITVIINEKKAPLCWIKFSNGLLQKFFVVWWKG